MCTEHDYFSVAVNRPTINSAALTVFDVEGVVLSIVVAEGFDVGHFRQGVPVVVLRVGGNGAAKRKVCIIISSMF